MRSFFVLFSSHTVFSNNLIWSHTSWVRPLKTKEKVALIYLFACVCVCFKPEYFVWSPKYTNFPGYVSNQAHEVNTDPSCNQPSCRTWYNGLVGSVAECSNSASKVFGEPLTDHFFRLNNYIKLSIQYETKNGMMK